MNTTKKNNDKTIYYANENHQKKCVLCGYEANKRLIFEHYLVKHSKHEVFIARLSPTYAEKSKSMPPLPAFNEKSQLKAICYFCETIKIFDKNTWADHILMHTGERNFICNNHFIPEKKVSRHHKNCGSYCSKLFNYQFEDNLLSAFICKYCNYVQTQEDNIQNHLVLSHYCNRNELLTEFYRKFHLISTQMCKPFMVKKENIRSDNQLSVSVEEHFNENQSTDVRIMRGDGKYSPFL